MRAQDDVYTVMKMLGQPTKAFKAYFQWGPMKHRMTTATQRHNLWVGMNMKITDDTFKYCELYTDLRQVPEYQRAFVPVWTRWCFKDCLKLLQTDLLLMLLSREFQILIVLYEKDLVTTELFLAVGITKLVVKF